MKKIIYSAVLLLVLISFTACTAEDLNENEQSQTEELATEHGEVGDPEDPDDEDEIGG